MVNIVTRSTEEHLISNFLSNLLDLGIRTATVSQSQYFNAVSEIEEIPNRSFEKRRRKEVDKIDGNFVCLQQKSYLTYMCIIQSVCKYVPLYTYQQY